MDTFTRGGAIDAATVDMTKEEKKKYKKEMEERINNFLDEDQKRLREKLNQIGIKALKDQ